MKIDEKKQLIAELSTNIIKAIVREDKDLSYMSMKVLLDIHASDRIKELKMEKTDA